MKSAKYSDLGARPPVGDRDQPEMASNASARFGPISWQDALGRLASPAFRLHRYRITHNRLLLDALRERDCSGDRSGDQ